MKIKELAPIFQQLTTIIPDLAYNKRYLLKIPMRSVIRGIHFDPSGFGKDLFNLSTFMMLLFIPLDHLNLSFGNQLRVPGQSWSMKMPDLVNRLVGRIQEEALPFLDQAPTLEAFITVMQGYSGCHARQTVAYALAKIGDVRQAIETIEEYVPKLDMSSHWQKEVAEDSRAFRHLLIYEPELAAAKLKEWEAETIRNLGLERFRSA